MAISATYSSVDPVKKSSITLCNRLLQRPYATLDELRQKGITNIASPQGKSIDDYGFISRTVLHEFTHAWPNRCKYSPDGVRRRAELIQPFARDVPRIG